MKSILIATVLTTLVAAVPPPPVNSDQPATGVDLATSQVAEKGPCYKQCRNHCLKVWSAAFLSPLLWPFVIAHCRRKCRNECLYENKGYDGINGVVDNGDDEDAVLDSASIIGTDGGQVTPEADEEKPEIQNLDMNMVD
ncbi:hypothetical protein QM012_002680 [Aureobasidium pullulans]|uniref:Uncharacterized protein n=1 Tax=Aureobasidium pullulans TaxID=5580 RepID=A0ABR0TAD0_AURPU